MSLIHLLDHWQSVSPSIQQAEGIWLGTDYDGTLAPISDDPAEDTLPPTTRQLLHDLLQIPAVRVAVISGRDILNLRERVGVPFLAYAGNHGLEMEWSDQREEHPESDRFRSVIQRLTAQLAPETVDKPGLFLQNKGVSLTAHFKRTPEWKDWLKSLIEKHLQPGDDFKIRGSFTAWDVRPYTSWNKGSALRRLRHQVCRQPQLSFFLGDDRSDEDAFAVLAESDFAVLVGEPRQTRAKYWLKDYHEVAELLRRIAELRLTS
jgi:trehalose 6-phosphate phosphatase